MLIMMWSVCYVLLRAFCRNRSVTAAVSSAYGDCRITCMTAVNSVADGRHTVDKTLPEQCLVRPDVGALRHKAWSSGPLCVMEKADGGGEYKKMESWQGLLVMIPFAARGYLLYLIFQPVHRHQNMAMPMRQMYSTITPPRKVYIRPVCISRQTLRSDIGSTSIRCGMGRAVVPLP